MKDNDQVKEAFLKVKEDIALIKDAINTLSDEIEEIKRTINPTHIPTQQTDRQITPTVPQEIRGLKYQKNEVSIGNDGVPTDRQTNQQTDKTNEKFVLIQNSVSDIKDNFSKIDKVSELLDSLDFVKKELRSKFKRLTTQEMFIFATIYQLEDEHLNPDYKLVSNKTNLSESSIRDYVLKIVKKGIPVDKIKENNKKITLSIPQSIRRMASLNTIIQLREL